MGTKKRKPIKVLNGWRKVLTEPILVTEIKDYLMSILLERQAKRFSNFVVYADNDAFLEEYHKALKENAEVWNKLTCNLPEAKEKKYKRNENQLPLVR